MDSLMGLQQPLKKVKLLITLIEDNINGIRVRKVKVIKHKAKKNWWVWFFQKKGFLVHLEKYGGQN